MNVLTVRAKVKEEHVADAEAAVKRMFAAIEREQLEGIRYASVKLEDGVTFLALLEVEDGVENPLPGLRRPRSSTTASRGGTPSRRRSDRERWSGPTRSSPTRSPRVEVRAGGLVPEVAVLDRCGRAATTSVVQPSPGWATPSAEPVDGGTTPLAMG